MGCLYCILIFFFLKLNLDFFFPIMFWVIKTDSPKIIDLKHFFLLNFDL